LNPPRERRKARETNVSAIVDIFYIFWSVKVFDFKAGDSAELRNPFRGLAESPRHILGPPFLFLFDLLKLILSEHELPSLQLQIADRKLQIEDVFNLKSEI
jgi:hypothetical protein